MAQENDRQRGAAADGSRTLREHPEPRRIEAHRAADSLPAHGTADEEPVPGVTAVSDSTPGFVKYGAAVLLGLAFGVGCYVWYSGGVPTAPENPDGPFVKAATYEYFNSPRAYNQPDADGTIPDPFGSPFEVTGYTSDPDIFDAGIVSVPDAGGSALARQGVAPGSGDLPSAGATARRSPAAVSPVTVVYLFKYDSSEVPETKSLTQLAEQAARSGVTIDVKAYTDDNGRAAYNQRLSERRAKAVAEYLIERGVPSAKITIAGMGATDRFGDDSQDRRAEVSLRQ